MNHDDIKIVEGDVPIPQGHFVYACMPVYVCLLHVASGSLGQEMTPDDTGGYTTGLQEERGNGLLLKRKSGLTGQVG
jgi:hypothetical protein